MKKTSINDFKKKLYEQKLEAEGRWRYSYDGSKLVGEINLSSIETKLIQEAGRWSKRFASDLLIDLWPIIRGLEDGTLRSTSILFGFREDGVDGASFVLARYSTPQDALIAQYYYRAIWKLDVEVETDDGDAVFIGGDIKVSLYECDR